MSVRSFASLLLRHRVQHTVGKGLRRCVLRMVRISSVFASEFALQGHHCDLQVLVTLLHMMELGRQFIVLRDRLFKTLLRLLQFTLLFQDLVIELVHLDGQVLVLLEQLSRLFALLIERSRVVELIHHFLRTLMLLVYGDNGRFWRLWPGCLARRLSQVGCCMALSHIMLLSVAIGQESVVL